MYRGIIQLSPSEQAAALLHLPQTDENQSLRQKLQVSPSQSGTNTQPIEVSLEQVETILDALPAPAPDSTTDLNSLRLKLSEFVQNSSR